MKRTSLVFALMALLAGSVVFAADAPLPVRTTLPAAGHAVPGAEFSWTPTTAIVGQPVQFTDQSTNAPFSWSWAFAQPGGGPLEYVCCTTQNPVRTFTSAGLAYAYLSVWNADGFSGLTSHTVNVITAPQAAAVEPVPALSISMLLVLGTVLATMATLFLRQH